MRSTDPEPIPQQPLGEKVAKPKTFRQEWRPVPGSPGILVNSKGEMKTDIRGNTPSPFTESP